ncbi:hypothetical protein ANABIO32_04160 [Rossellomorea marisflavi]|nr:hypothetical protein ANABIO32_04160 [Rossellomorea marisflavi]
MSNKSTTIKSFKMKIGDTRYLFRVYVCADPSTGKEQTTTRPGFK